MNQNTLSLVLAGVGGMALVGALLARMAAKPQVQTSPNATLADTAIPAAEIAATTKPISPDPDNNSAEADEIEWQECEDTYCPRPVTASEFVQTLGLARPPAILPQQAYIFVKRSVLEKVQAHLQSNVKVELGGLILGQAFLDNALGATLLVVHEALPAPDGIETPTFFGYTTASWQSLTPQLQQMDADWTILGSYHSHPDMGVFLSATDLDTQEDIFSADWQLALVVDPVRDEIGFFIGKDGQPCADWYYI